MPYEIKLEATPAGYVGTPARAGEIAQIIFREFTSTEDGQHFITGLETGVDPILRELPTQVPPSKIEPHTGHQLEEWPDKGVHQ